MAQYLICEDKYSILLKSTETAKMKSNLFKTSLFLLAGLVLFSCGKEKETVNLENCLATYVENTEDILLFGSMDPLGIMKKADYQNIPKVNVVIEDYINMYQESLVLESGVYFAASGKNGIEGNPDFVAFLAIKNKDSLQARMLEDGYDFEKQEKFDYAFDGDVSLGVNNEVLVIYIQNDLDAGVSSLESTFKKLKMKATDEKLKKEVVREGDIHLSIYNTRMINPNAKNDVFSDENKLANLLKLTSNDRITLSVHFEDGAMRLVTKTDLGEESKKWNYLNKDDKATILSDLGGGAPNFAFSLNMNPRLFQEYIETYSGKSLYQMLEKADPKGQQILMMAGGKLSNIINGRAGVAVTAPQPGEFSTFPATTVYSGLGAQGEAIAQFLITDEYLEQAEAEAYIDEHELVVTNKGENIKSAITVPKGCEEFGKHGASMFITLEGIDLDSFGMGGGAFIANMIDHIFGYMDAEGGEFKIQLKDTKVNFLKQLIDGAVLQFEDKLSRMSIY